jgi:prevent-host-death family protein
MDMQRWQMQTAKARFSELVKNAAQDGPQDITLHGRSVAVVISREQFDRLFGNQESLVDFMRASPLYGREDIVFEREKGLSRDIEF